jgi:hypothetical protein
VVDEAQGRDAALLDQVDLDPTQRTSPSAVVRCVQTTSAGAAIVTS